MRDVFLRVHPGPPLGLDFLIVFVGFYLLYHHRPSPYAIPYLHHCPSPGHCPVTLDDSTLRFLLRGHKIVWGTVMMMTPTLVWTWFPSFSWANSLLQAPRLSCSVSHWYRYHFPRRGIYGSCLNLSFPDFFERIFGRFSAISLLTELWTWKSDVVHYCFG